jgi:hypothetical protein
MPTADPDEIAFSDFMAARWNALFRTAYLITGDRHEAEDLLQTARAIGLHGPAELDRPCELAGRRDPAGQRVRRRVAPRFRLRLLRHVDALWVGLEGRPA